MILQELSRMEVKNMLLEFKTKNYKSFVDEACFSMITAPKQKGLDYSIMKEKVKGKEIPLLFMDQMRQEKQISSVQWMC